MSEDIAHAVALSTRLAPRHALELALDHSTVDRSDQYLLWVGRLLPKLGRFLEDARGVHDIRLVATRDVAAWVDAPLPSGVRPSVATRHNRRSAASAGFRLLRDLGLMDHDPTLDLDLPLRGRGRQTRPLTDSEVEAGRAASLRTLSESRLPAVWALGEATATTHEIPRVRTGDVDLDSGTVRLSGSAKTQPRTAELTAWGVDAITARLEALPAQNISLTYQGKGSARSMQASSSSALAKTLREAGLRTDPSAKPESVRAWAGLRVWMRTGLIEAAALVLGCTSLDTAATVIGYEWAEGE